METRLSVCLSSRTSACVLLLISFTNDDHDDDDDDDDRSDVKLRRSESNDYKNNLQ